MKFLASPYHQSRNGYKPEIVVIHTMDGFYESTLRYFQKNDRSVSAHYCVSLKGDITQMVDEERASHHAGNIASPSIPLIVSRPNVNPNWYSIGIENDDGDNPGGADRSLQYPELIKLVADICRRNNIPADRDHIVGHREIYNKKSCPGNIDMAYLVLEVKKRLGTVPAIGGTMSKLSDFLGMSNEDDAIKRLTEHLGVQDGKCDWGNEEGERGGYLGGARRKIKELQSNIPVSPVDIPVPPAPKVVGWKVNGLQLQVNNALYNYEKE